MSKTLINALGAVIVGALFGAGAYMAVWALLRVVTLVPSF